MRSVSSFKRNSFRSGITHIHKQTNNTVVQCNNNKAMHYYSVNLITLSDILDVLFGS